MADSNPGLPVFYDPEQKRWPLVRAVLVSLGATLAVLFVLLIVSVVFHPVLPALGLSPSEPSRMARTAPRRQAAAATDPSRAEFVEIRRELFEEKGRSLLDPPPVVMTPPPAGAPLVFGYFVNWDLSGISSLKANADAMDVLVPEWLHVAGADGAVTEDEAFRQKEVRDWLQEHRPGLLIMPLVNNYNDATQSWDGGSLAKLLQDPASRGLVIGRLMEYTRKAPCAGLNVDFEEIPAPGRPAFHAFLAELGTRIRAAGMRLSVTVPAEGADVDYRAVSAAADYVVLTVYDQHSPSTPAGPLAAADWMAGVLRERAADVPPGKMVICLGNGAYDWTEGRAGGEAATWSFDEAMLTARDGKAEIVTDAASQNPTFSYRDEERREHRVWFLDAATAFNQVAAIRPLKPRGLALWRLGAEDPSVWKVLARDAALNAATAAELSDMNFRYRLTHVGDGEVIQVTERSQPGRREIAFDPARGIITSERFVQLPAPYVVKGFGTKERKIALTFDDGPDPRATPAILDILREKNAPATFFIIGSNGEAHPELLRREVAEGHEIGNHTFTHPFISKITAAQFRLEIAATGRLIESATQRQSLLFRPPYAEFEDPTTPEAVERLGTVNEMGYLVVGMRLDTDDWKLPGAAAIVSAAVDAAGRGEGHVVLMHDGGGDRAQTIQALPALIDGLRAKGFELVTVSDLVGRTRDDVMPPLTGRKKMVALFNRGVFGLVGLGMDALAWLFLLGIALGSARLLFVGALALVDGRRRRLAAAAGRTAPPCHPERLPAVGVIVPAYNEEKVIVHTIDTLLDCRYAGPLEVVVVDDGSQDGTLRRVRKAFQHDPRVRIFGQENAGKSAALNFGIRQTSAEIIVALDADTVFRPDTIAKLVRHFVDPTVGAVAGNAKVGNRTNVLTKWQALEYITSQNLDRRAFHVLNCITVVPGAVGAWRRELVERLGGFTHVTLAEDTDLTISIRRLGYKVLYDEEAVALTEAPDTIRGFLKQRFRWMYGTVQAAWKHRDCLLNPRHGALGWVALPNIVIFQVFFALISPVMDLMLVLSLAGTLFTVWQHPGQATVQTLLHTLLYYGLFTAADFGAAAVAFALEPKEDRRLLWWLLPQRFLYRQLLYCVAIQSTFVALRGGKVGWGKVARKATVRLMPVIRRRGRTEPPPLAPDAAATV